MGAKSVLEIDVNDDKFQSFLEKFREYQSAIGELPEAWREAAQGISVSAKATETAQVNENTGAMTKLVTLSALQAVLQAHSNLGGTYVVATPGIIYSNCILRTVRDVTGGNETTPQSQWLWDFEQPLVTETSADQAVTNFLNKIDAGDKQTSSAWTNTTSALGNTALGSGVTSGINGLISSLKGTFGI